MAIRWNYSTSVTGGWGWLVLFPLLAGLTSGLGRNPNAVSRLQHSPPPARPGDDETVEFSLPAPSEGTETLILIGSLGDAGRTYSVVLEVQGSSPDLQSSSPRNQSLERERRPSPQRPALFPRSSAPRPTDLSPEIASEVDREPSNLDPHSLRSESSFTRRVFFLQTGPSPLLETSYQPIVARCDVETPHVRIWVDEACAKDISPMAQVWFAQNLEYELLPQIADWFGEIIDIDADGKLSVCFTSRLSELPTAESRVEGLVQANDFVEGLPRPFSNQADIMFLSPTLEPGPHGRAIMAHEAAHLAVFSRRSELGGKPDDDWLNEGLAHFAEMECARHGSNLEQRLAAFAAAPGDAPLVVVDAQQQGLWRHAGARGAAWLFLAWLADDQGPQLIRQLPRNSDTGCLKLERLTQETFADLFRRWSVAIWTSSERSEEPDKTVPIHLASFHESTENARQSEGWLRDQGPRPKLWDGSVTQTELALRGTAVDAIAWKAPEARLRITSPTASRLQITLLERTAQSCRITVIR